MSLNDGVLSITAIEGNDARAIAGVDSIIAMAAYQQIGASAAIQRIFPIAALK